MNSHDNIFIWWLTLQIYDKTQLVSTSLSRVKHSKFETLLSVREHDRIDLPFICAIYASKHFCSIYFVCCFGVIIPSNKFFRRHLRTGEYKMSAGPLHEAAKTGNIEASVTVIHVHLDSCEQYSAHQPTITTTSPFTPANLLGLAHYVFYTYSDPFPVIWHDPRKYYNTHNKYQYPPHPHTVSTLPCPL